MLSTLASNTFFTADCDPSNGAMKRQSVGFYALRRLVAPNVVHYHGCGAISRQLCELRQGVVTAFGKLLGFGTYL
ncbi:uncharacterized protein EAF02_008608 [Botrytis sinoallii]|uniref:uncharacterized protein n=1 Tax=Botrytis sinoallii TaxID=1463999 RepID=UPI001900BD45|nr:uncharacterized protein EAF02_008608 [Botrytis sinoallii]KAF7874631.1 hypothetical protein EAF02_008608 [Botrytis sinoallii]